MAITLNIITSGYNIPRINDNFQKIEDYINTTLLARAETGVAGEAKMSRDLDMDGYKILNADLDGSSITNDRAVRVLGAPIPAIPQDANSRKGKVVSFDINTGNPVAIAPASGSAVDVLNQLAAADGYKLVPSVFNALSEIPVELFRTVGMTDKQVIVAADSFGASHGYKIVFESGRTYTFDTITATTSWRGNGATLVRTASTSLNMIVVSSGVTVEGFTINGNKSVSTPGTNTVYVYGVNGAVVKNNTITNAPGHGVFIQDFSDSTTRKNNKVLDNVITGATSAGVYCYNALGTDIKGNDISTCNDGMLGQGSARNFSKITIESNYVHNNASNGISFNLISEAADQQAFERLKIVSNMVINNAAQGIVCQADYSLVANNHIHGNGSQTYHQGVLVNANNVAVTSNIITRNGGVGIDFGDCRKVSATANHIEENGWIGIEVNSCEQATVTGNILNLNFRGKTPADLQAAILLHKGTGGYTFLGDNKDITVTGNTIMGGEGQQYAILVADTNCYNITITGNTCKSAAFAEDIVSRSPDVIIRNNFTRWDVGGAARATISSGIVPIPSVADTVYVNGTGSVITVNIKDAGSYIKDRTVRLVAVNGCTFENSGGSGGNLYLGSSQVIAAGRSIVLWSDGSGGWVKA